MFTEEGKDFRLGIQEQTAADGVVVVQGNSMVKQVLELADLGAPCNDRVIGVDVESIDDHEITQVESLMFQGVAERLDTGNQAMVKKTAEHLIGTALDSRSEQHGWCGVVKRASSSHEKVEDVGHVSVKNAVKGTSEVEGYSKVEEGLDLIVLHVFQSKGQSALFAPLSHPLDAVQVTCANAKIHLFREALAMFSHKGLGPEHRGDVKFALDSCVHRCFWGH